MPDYNQYYYEIQFILQSTPCLLFKLQIKYIRVFFQENYRWYTVFKQFTVQTMQYYGSSGYGTIMG